MSANKITGAAAGAAILAIALNFSDAVSKMDVNSFNNQSKDGIEKFIVPPLDRSSGPG